MLLIFIRRSFFGLRFWNLFLRAFIQRILTGTSHQLNTGTDYGGETNTELRIRSKGDYYLELSGAKGSMGSEMGFIIFEDGGAKR